jgi:predicted nucleic acid-binding protein
MTHYPTVDRSDQNHERVVELLPTLSGEIMILPVPVLVETAYLLQGRLGHEEMRHFLARLINGPIQFETIIKDDLPRIHELLEKYGDAQLDFVDASITALAERLNIQTILTVDQRDFRIIRPLHCTHCEILP